MNLAAIVDWLKNSILGIVLLGAIGSLVSVFVLKYMGPPLRALALKPVWYHRKETAWRYWRSAAAYHHIVYDATNRKLIFYLFRHLARLVLACGVFVTTTVVFAVVVASRSEVLLTYGTFVLSTLIFLCGYWIKAEYDYITINYVIEWRKTGLVKDPFPNDPGPIPTGKKAAPRSEKPQPSK